MPFTLLPVTLQDFDLIRPHPWDLPYSTTRTSSNELDFQIHEMVLGRHRLAFQQDPRVKFYKVVDDEGHVVSLARWSIFNDDEGFQTSLYSRAWRHEFREPTHEEGRGWTDVDISYDPRLDDWEGAYDRQRQAKLAGKKLIVLASLATHVDFQRRGAARMLMDELARQADELGLEVHLRSSPEGKRVYEQIGCRATGEVFEHHFFSHPYICSDMVREPRRRMAMEEGSEV